MLSDGSGEWYLAFHPWSMTFLAVSSCFVVEDQEEQSGWEMLSLTFGLTLGQAADVVPSAGLVLAV